MQTVRLHTLRYDPAGGAFEGRVDVERDGRTFRYPCRVEAPESAPRAGVEEALIRQALRMSDTVRMPAAAPRPGFFARAATACRLLAAGPAPAPVPAPVSRTPHPRATH